MTPVTWQAAVDDEEQRPLLQDILEAAVDDRRQAAVDVEEQWPQLQDLLTGGDCKLGLTIVRPSSLSAPETGGGLQLDGRPHIMSALGADVYLFRKCILDCSLRTMHDLNGCESGSGSGVRDSV